MTSARPSVINLRYTFTPVCAPRQPSTRSGIPSGKCAAIRKFQEFQHPLRIAPHCKSGLVPKAVKSTDSGNRPRRFDYRSRCVPLAAVASKRGGFFIAHLVEAQS